MKNWLIVMIALGASGCSGSLLPLTRTSSTPIFEVGDGEMLQPYRSISDLLTLRLQLCNRPAQMRKEFLATQPEPLAERENPVDEQKLNALLLASCEPARTPGVLNQLLAELTAEGTWPEDYAAFFDLLIAAQKSYASVEKLYLQLQADHAALQDEHERTILGLGEIESQLEQQSQQPAVP